VTIPESVAVIYRASTDFPTVGGYLARGIQQAGAHAEHFEPGEETAGFDHYVYVDDSPTAYGEPMFRPATYWAIDMVLPQLWFLQTPEQYFERLSNFDNRVVTSTAAERYCLERGLPVKLVTFAADPQYHRPHPEVERDLDWVAVHHNCGDRIEACNLAAEAFPNAWVTWRGWDLYAETISRGKCVINWLRGNLVNMRVFEAMAIGTPLVTTRNLDMDRFGFVEGQHYLGYVGVDEMIDKIGWVNGNMDRALEIASRAREFVLAHHTYRHRALEMLS
jgi:spore maturation protein CgeB